MSLVGGHLRDAAAHLTGAHDANLLLFAVLMARPSLDHQGDALTATDAQRHHAALLAALTSARAAA